VPVVAKNPPPSRADAQAERKRKLTFAEKKELEELPGRIDALERERDGMYDSLADPSLLRDGSAVAAARSRLVALEAEIATLTGRWEALETVAGGG